MSDPKRSDSWLRSRTRPQRQLWEVLQQHFNPRMKVLLKRPKAMVQFQDIRPSDWNDSNKGARNIKIYKDIDLPIEMIPTKGAQYKDL